MSLLAKIRQDASSAAAVAEARLAERAMAEASAAGHGAGVGVAVQREAPPVATGSKQVAPTAPAASTTPALTTPRPAARPIPLLARDVWWSGLEVIFDDEFPDGAHLTGCPIPGGSSRLPPTVDAAPCSTCDSPFFWESIDGAVHCIGCVPIPSRRMADGAAWVVTWDAKNVLPQWADWTPRYWRPFAHLEAAEGQRQEQQAAAVAASNGDF